MHYLINTLGILHRDLKGRNIFLDNAGNQIIAKIGDFGLALNKITNFYPDYCGIGTLEWMVKIFLVKLQMIIF